MKETTRIKRNYGIDVLRMLSMFYVVMLHILGHGGILEASQGKQSAVSWLLETFALCAVDCYAIISGYVGYSEEEKSYRYSRYIELWIQVAFYSVLLTAIFMHIFPEIGWKDLLESCFPVAFGKYWYFTAYTGVFFLAPWINKFVLKMDAHDLKKIVFVLLALFSVYATITGILSYDPFHLSAGYSCFWLAILYLLGACMKKLNFTKRVSIGWCGIVFILAFTITYGSKMLIPLIGKTVCGYSFSENFLLQYNSPTILAIAVTYVCVFSKIQLGKISQKIISFWAPATFGVYLIQDNVLTRRYLISGRFSFVAGLAAWKIPFVVCFYVFVIFVICLAIDRFRTALFKILKVRQGAELIEKKVRIIMKKWI